jgi:3-oxoacyl-(acyl-carrier-protein) synthase
MKAAVTGWAWRTPLGADLDTAMGRLWAGERAATPNPHFDPSGYRCQLVAPLLGPAAPSRNARFLRRLGLFALEAAGEAIRAAGQIPDQRFGVFAAMGGLRACWEEIAPALTGQRADAAGAWSGGLQRLHPFWLLTHLSNNAHALLAAEVGARGEGVTFAGATAGAQALAAALRALEADAVDAACVVAYDSLIEPETLVVLGERGGARGPGPVAAPYDERAAGVVPGEGAAAVILERRERAGPRALALLDAAGGADGAEGEPAAATIARVAARLSSGVEIIDGAARAQPGLDGEERAALSGLTDPQAPLVAATAAMGQLGAATALVQAIALGQALRRGLLPPIAGLARAAAGPLVPVPRALATCARTGLAISTGAPGLVGVVRVEVPS